MMNRARLWVRSIILHRRLEREMQEEMAEHLERATARLMARGLSAPEARREATLEFGNVAYLQAVQKELTKLGRALYGDKKPTAGYKREGWGEYVRSWITQTDLGGNFTEPADLAPEVTKWFEGVQRGVPGSIRLRYRPVRSGRHRSGQANAAVKMGATNAIMASHRLRCLIVNLRTALPY